MTLTFGAFSEAVNHPLSDGAISPTLLGSVDAHCIALVKGLFDRRHPVKRTELVVEAVVEAVVEYVGVQQGAVVDGAAAELGLVVATLGVVEQERRG